MNQHYYITSPIYYVNDSPHIGHAYTSLACDVMARFMRLAGHKVKFLTGTDEHGQKVEKSATNTGLSPLEFTTQVSERFRTLTPLLNLSNDDFIRTTEPRHMQAAQSLWNKLKANGHIYLSKYSGWYSVRDEAFYQESELVDGKAPTGAPVEWVEEPSYFFDLSKWQDKLLELYKQCPDFVKPASRLNEVVSFVKGGLQDLSISRTSFKWGIKIPGDESHVMYVWLDALTNYISALGYPDTESADFTSFWPANVHIVGKDILRFHAVYWPAFLMAADLPVPRRVVAHGWWTSEGQKISKSLGNTIDPVQLVEEFGLDQTRYFLMREVPFGNDGNFSRNAMIRRINSELANNIGNLAQRTLSMIYKNCQGALPEFRSNEISNIEQLYTDTELLQKVSIAYITIQQHMLNQEFSEALEVIINLANQANIYIDTQAPWTLAKNDHVKMQQVLYVLAEAIRYIAILLQPFIPDAASNLLSQLAVQEQERSFDCLNYNHALKSGTLIGQPVAVFPRYNEQEAKNAG